MKHSARSVWVSILVLCLVAAALTWGLMQYASVSSGRNSDSKTDMKMEGIRLTLSNLSAAQIQADKDFEQQLRDNLGLLSLPLRSIVAAQGDEAIQNYVYGCVLRREGDEYILPEDRTAIPLLEPLDINDPMPYTPAECDPFRDSEGAFWSVVQGEEANKTVLCAYRRIRGDYYYLYYTPLTSVESFYQNRFDTESVKSGAEAVYGGVFAAWVEEDGEYRPFYASDVFDGHSQPADLGVEINKGKTDFRPTVVDDVQYMYAVSSPMWVSSIGNRIRIAYFIPNDQFYGATYGDSVILAVIAMAFFLALTVWVLAAKRLIGRKTVTQTQRRHYGARRMRLVAASLGAIGFAFILLTSLFAGALTDVYNSTTTCQSALDTLHTMAEETSEHEERLADQYSEQYLSYARRIAILLGLYPDLKTREQLAEMSETIGADYLMLFDDKGNEILSDSRYVNLSYGMNESEATADFRRLITGVPGIVHPPLVDEVTGLYRQLIGVSMDDGDISNGYGSLIVAVEPVTADENTLSMDDIMRSLTTSNGMIFSVDRESGVIENSSSRGLVGKNAVELGMSDKNLREGFMDFFTLDGQDRYGCSVEQGGTLYYATVRTSSMFQTIFQDSLIPALMFLAGYAVLALTLLAGYTDRRIDESGITVVDDHDWAYRDSQREEDEKRGWWARKTPEGKAGFVLMILFAVAVTGLAIAYGAGAMSGGIMTIIPYVMGGSWTRGFNLFALTRIVMLFGSVVLILLGMKALLSILCGILDTKGETICRLSFNLLRYVVVIVGLFFSLEALGFDTSTLLASLGIFSLAISLGAKDLVADVLSGITIVFSGEYQIGDIVEIAGFRGRVWEIGVRSTSIVNKDGNLKNISNRNVANVMNLSRLNSRYNMQVAIPYDQSMDKVQEMLAKELPRIGQEIDDIAHGPVYQGVTGMEAGYVSLGFYAECAEEDVGKVCDKMNRAIKALFEKYEIPIK